MQIMYVETLPFPDFPQSLGTLKERLESCLSMLVYVFAAAVTIMLSFCFWRCAACFCSILSRDERS